VVNAHRSIEWPEGRVHQVSVNDEKDEIKVEDKRHFDREGNPIGPAEEKDQKPPRPKEAKSPPKAEPSEKSAKQEKIDFIAVLFSYVHTALIYLGDMEDPVKKGPAENLEGAHQMIEILELMQAKTKGNLTNQEQQYLESALFDLRMRYMQKSKIIK
jgi:hypothetical protein